jgi:hypothetical protein
LLDDVEKHEMPSPYDNSGQPGDEWEVFVRVGKPGEKMLHFWDRSQRFGFGALGT